MALVHETPSKVSLKSTPSIGCAKINIHPSVNEVSCSEFIQSLLLHLGSSGSIIVWNQTFENTRLREIAREFPEYASMIEPWYDRVTDLLVPFRKRHLYTTVMNGSYFLKAVLPALVPDLSYSNLEIHEGGSAGLTYESLYNDTDPESIATKEESLEIF